MPTETEKLPSGVFERVDAIVAEKQSKNGAETKAETKTEETKAETKTETKKEEKAPESKAETKTDVKPEVKAEAKSEEKKTEPKSWFDEEEKKSSETEAKAETKTEPEKDPIYEDDFVKAVVAARKAGKDWSEIQKAVQGTDPSTMSPKDLYKLDLADLGLSEAEMTEELSKFDEMSKAEQLRNTKSIKERLIKERGEKLKQFSQSAEETLNRRKEVVQKAQTELDTHLSGLVGKDYYGATFTKEMADDARNYISKELSLFRPDGSYDIETLVEFATWRKHKKTIVKANVDKARNAGKKEVIDEVTRADANNSEGKLPTGAEDTKDQIVTEFRKSFRDY